MVGEAKEKTEEIVGCWERLSQLRKMYENFCKTPFAYLTVAGIAVAERLDGEDGENTTESPLVEPGEDLYDAVERYLKKDSKCHELAVKYLEVDSECLAGTPWDNGDLNRCRECVRQLACATLLALETAATTLPLMLYWAIDSRVVEGE